MEALVRAGAAPKAFVRYNAQGRWGWLDDSPVKDHIEVVLGDVTDAASLRRAMQGVDVVFHLAALVSIPYSYQAVQSFLNTNVIGTANVLQLALEESVGLVVHTSTSEVYGTAQYIPIDEHHPLQGQSPYSATKIAADKLAEAFHRSYGLPVVTVRPFNTYGPRQSSRAVIPSIITQALGGQTVRLGHSWTVRDFTYVADTVRAYLLTAERQDAAGQVINVGSASEVTIEGLGRRIGDLLGKPVSIVWDEQRARPVESEVARLLADNRKAKTMIGWEPTVSLDDGLAATIAWIQQNLHAYRVGIYAI